MIFDTSIILDMLKDRREFENGSISVITLLEIVRGIADNDKRRLVLNNLIESFYIYWLTNDIVLAYSELYNKLKGGGKTLGDADLIIAATALVSQEKLVTKDKDFKSLKDSITIVFE